MGRKALLFPDEKTLKELRKTLGEYRPMIEKFTTASNLTSLCQLINRQFSKAKREKNAQTDALIQGLPALERIIAQADDSLKRSGTPPSPGITAMFGSGQEAESDMYITFANGTLYLVTAHAKREDLNTDAVIRIRELVRQIQGEVPGLNVRGDRGTRA